MSVRPSIRMEQLGSHWKDFHEIWHFSIFRKSIEKIQVSLKSARNNKHFTWSPIRIFLSYLAHFFLEREMFQTRFKKKSKHISCSIAFFSKIMPFIRWKNIVEPGRPQKTIRRMRIACWINKDTDTHSEYVIIIAFPLQQWLH